MRRRVLSALVMLAIGLALGAVSIATGWDLDLVAVVGVLVIGLPLVILLKRKIDKERSRVGEDDEGSA